MPKSKHRRKTARGRRRKKLHTAKGNGWKHGVGTNRYPRRPK
jgi:hypothetical protein